MYAEKHKMYSENCLTVNNCPLHTKNMQFNFICVGLSTKCYELPSIDQTIINNIKLHCRIRILSKSFGSLEGEKKGQITLWDAIINLIMCRTLMFTKP